MNENDSLKEKMDTLHKTMLGEQQASSSFLSGYVFDPPSEQPRKRLVTNFRRRLRNYLSGIKDAILGRYYE